MTANPKLNWWVPSDEVELFEVFVREKYGEIEGRLGYEIRQAMREWTDTDEYAAVEQEVDRYVQAAGRTPAALAEKKRGSEPPFGGDKRKLRNRVPRDLKGQFASCASEQDENPGDHLARALRERRTSGGRAKRIEDKLDRVGDDVEALLTEAGPQAEGEMSTTERRTVAICRRLGEQFTEDDLDVAIGTVAGDSPPTLRDYRERVFDRLDHVEHPYAPELFVPEETAREIAENTDAPGPDAPAFDRKDLSDLTREEKVHGLRIVLARQAEKNNGRRRLDVKAVRTEVFESEPSDSHARTLMRRAGQAEGFEFVKVHGKDQLQVDLRDVPDDDLRELVGKGGGPSR